MACAGTTRYMPRAAAALTPWQPVLKTRSLIAALVVATGLVAHAAASPAVSYPDKLLDFKDTELLASNNTFGPILWLSNSTALVNAATVRSGQKAAGVNVVAVNVRDGSTTLVAEDADLLCWVSQERFGVLRRSTGASVRLVADDRNTVRVTAEPATREDCLSRQYFLKRGTAVTDLGRGAGVIIVERAAGQDVTSTYVQEDGTRIPLSYPGGHFGGSGMYRPWLGEYSVGKANDFPLRMRKDGNLRLDTSDESLSNFFRGPSPVETRNGYVVRTGVSDPYNGDTFFVPTGGSPVRIYKSKGGWDQLGPGSVAPDGCVVLLSMSANGPLNRVLAYANRAPQTLHYVDVCAAFPLK